MIIEIESYLGDKLISGKTLSIGQLKHQMEAILKQVSEKDFVSIFCARYDFEVLPYDENIEAHYVVDLDTHMVFQPKYDD